jgi:protein-tyrosine phosphatase
VIDLHSHILPGLDDGVPSLAEARALARASSSGGVTAIVATPHVRDDYPTTPEQMEAALAELRRNLADHGIAVDVLAGGELALDRVDALGPEALAPFTLARTGRYALVEFPYYGFPLGLEGSVRRLRSAGITPILAHPERNAEIQGAPQLLRRALAAGALVQITADSLAGTFGKRAKRGAGRLLELGFAHVVASDAHSARSALRRDQVAKAIRDRRLARYLTVEVPAAVVAGDDLR